MKKGQMEILGLAIVVVLILVAAVFLAGIMISKKPSEQRKGFTRSVAASNTVSALLRASAEDCKYLTMTELLQDCAQGRSISCDDAQNSDSCKFAESTAEFVFGKTLEQWGFEYHFLAYVDKNHPLISIGTPCKGELETYIQPIPLKLSSMYVKMDICA